MAQSVYCGRGVVEGEILVPVASVYVLIEVSFGNGPSFLAA
jgi:hypothetical protein